MPTLVGYAAALTLLFPAVWIMGASANPALGAMAARAPVVVSGPDCRYDPFAADQKTACGRLLGDLTAIGVRYRVETAPDLTLSAGATALPLTTWYAADKPSRSLALQSALTGVGYNLGKVRPSPLGMVGVVAGLVLAMAISAASYGPLAVLLVEMFPPRIRYSSMSIPYHIGTGYFGGFLPFISSLIIAQTGNPYAGLWYPWAVTLIALPVAAIGLRHVRLPEQE